MVAVSTQEIEVTIIAPHEVATEGELGLNAGVIQFAYPVERPG